MLPAFFSLLIRDKKPHPDSVNMLARKSNPEPTPDAGWPNILEALEPNRRISFVHPSRSLEPAQMLPDQETKPPIQVAISGAAGTVGYGLVFRIAAGGMFGADQPVALRLLEHSQQMQLLAG